MLQSPPCARWLLTEPPCTLLPRLLDRGEGDAWSEVSVPAVTCMCCRCLVEPSATPTADIMVHSWGDDGGESLRFRHEEDEEDEAAVEHRNGCILPSGWWRGSWKRLVVQQRIRANEKKH